SAVTGGFDLLHRVHGYEAQAMLVGSRVNGTRDAMIETQEDGVHYFQRPGARGVDSSITSMNGWALPGRVAETDGNVHWEIGQRAYSPGYEPNDAGFLAQSDRTLFFAHADYVRPVRDDARLRRWWVGTNLWDYHDFSGMLTALGANTIGLVQ